MAAPVLQQGPPSHATREERRFALHGVPWWTYVALRDTLKDQSGLKMTYLEGALEFMSPSKLHEDAKTIIARLIEAWAMQHDLDLRGFGGTTFRREAGDRGLEPDECYKLGELAEEGVPDIAIEVAVTSWLIDKLAVYAGLGVPEVWLWSPDTSGIVVHCLVGKNYEVRKRSRVLPDLDVEELSQFVRPGESQTKLCRTYLERLRQT